MGEIRQRALITRAIRESRCPPNNGRQSRNRSTFQECEWWRIGASEHYDQGKWKTGGTLKVSQQSCPEFSGVDIAVEWRVKQRVFKPVG